MNRFFGCISFDGNFGPEPSVQAQGFELIEGSFYRLWIERDDAGFLDRIETPRLVLLVTGYVDQPLDADALSALQLLASHYTATGSLPDAQLFGSLQFLLIDKAERRVILGGDNGAARRVFYAQSGTGWRIASKLHLFRRFGDEPEPPTETSRNFSLIYGFFPDDETPYRGVRHISGPRNLVLSAETMRIVERSPAQKSNLKTAQQMGFSEAAKSLYETLLAAVERSAAGYRRVAVLLGGFDSALLCSLLVRAGKEVETFTFRYADPRFTQTHTDTLAAFLGIRHNWVDIDEEVIREGFEQYAECFDQPTNWPAYVTQTAHACRQIRQAGFVACFSGDGCDTLFQGYPGVFRSADFYNHYARYLRRLAPPLLHALDSKRLEMRLGHVYRLVFRMLRNSMIEDPQRSFLMFRIWDESSLAHLFGGRADDIAREVATVARGLVEKLPRDLSYAQLAYLGRSFMGPNRTKLSGSMDTTGLKIFSPYMHHQVKAFASTLPEEYLRDQKNPRFSNLGKRILIEMARSQKLLPEEVITQRKQAPVNLPIDAWYEGPLRSYVMSRLEALPWKMDKVFLESLFDRKAAEEIYKKRLSADYVVSHALSQLLTTAAFFHG